MSKMLCMVAVLGALAAATPTSVSLAKPPDLPAENDVRCPEGREEFTQWPLLAPWGGASREIGRAHV